MSTKEAVKVARDLDVVQIPEGFKVRLIRGTSVRLMQALGDSFTVMTEYGTMVRVSGQDAEAIGEAIPASAQTQAGRADLPKSTEEVKTRVWEALRGVYDPEIPVNVVELGLVYNNEVSDMPGGFKVDVRMTLTAPGCGMGPVLQSDAESRIQSIPGVKAAHVELVIDPPWNSSMMSEAARLQLGL